MKGIITDFRALLEKHPQAAIHCELSDDWTQVSDIVETLQTDRTIWLIPHGLGYECYTERFKARFGRLYL